MGEARKRCPRVASGVPKFYQLRGPEDEEVGDIVIVIADKIIAYLRQLNYLPAENDESAETTAPFDQEFADSETYFGKSQRIYSMVFLERHG